MPTAQAQDVSPMMRPTKSGGRAGSGKAGRPFGRTRKKASQVARKPAGRRTGARKGGGGRRGRAKKTR